MPEDEDDNEGTEELNFDIDNADTHNDGDPGFADEGDADTRDGTEEVDMDLRSRD